MIDSTYNLLNKDYIDSLLDGIADDEIELPNSTNYYNRYHLSSSDTLKNLLESFLYEKYNRKYLLKNNGLWINKVTKDTNKDDSFHVDESNLTIVTYLNDDFLGGMFEYKDEFNQTIQIKPVKGLSLIMDSVTQHRVLPVSEGTRYSMVCFFDILNKNKKTLL